MGTQTLDVTEDIDRANAEFWDELCGSALARELGIGAERSRAALAEFDRGYIAFYPYLLKRVPVATMSGQNVLEIGLGYGTLGQQIAEAAGYYFGLDIAEGPVRMMAHRLRMGALRGAAVRGSMLECPCRSESQDVVVAIGCFHHTGNVARCIEETYRVLKPGGRAFLMVYNLFSRRQWSVAPAATLKAVLGEGPAGVRRAGERERVLYDANSAGQPAPETVFLSRRGLARLLRRFRSVAIRAENDDPLVIRRRTLATRETMLRFAKWWGLDLYVSAEK